MKIKLADIVNDTYTNASGYELYTCIKKVMDKTDTIDLSFKDMPAPSSSFLNSSFGAIIEEIGLQNFINLVKPKELTPTQAQMLKHYIQGFKTGTTKH